MLENGKRKGEKNEEDKTDRQSDKCNGFTRNRRKRI